MQLIATKGFWRGGPSRESRARPFPCRSAFAGDEDVGGDLRDAATRSNTTFMAELFPMTVPLPPRSTTA